jgi:hypothetical protein
MNYAGLEAQAGHFRGLLMRIGGSIALALIVFGAGMLSMPPTVHAQDQDAAPPVYVTPNSDQSAKPLFLRKLFGTNEPNSGIGTPKPYDFSHNNQAERTNDNSDLDRETQELQEAFNQHLSQYVAEMDEMFDAKRKARMTLAAQDRERHRTEMDHLRAISVAAAQTVAQRIQPHSGAGNFVHPHQKKPHAAGASHSHGRAPSGEAPPIYVQH